MDAMIKVSDFSRYPTGRDENDGMYNGTRFRTEYLRPAVADAIQHGGYVVVSLDNVNSLGSSFLEEAFGGLVRKEHMPKKDIKNVLRIQAESLSLQRYVDAIWRHIEVAN